MSYNNELKYYNKYLNGILSGCPEYDYTDKATCMSRHVAYMLNRSQSMFEWHDLPDTIPQRILELYLQTNGNVCFYQYNDKLYVFTGGLGGEYNVYYMPTIYVIANPALNMSVSAKIDIDCVVMPNDSMYLGLLPLYHKYATFMTETELSLNIAAINSRIFNLISASDDVTKNSAEKYLADVKDGKMGVIAESAFLDGIKAQPFGSAGTSGVITDLIELEQYYKASWYNDIGLNANYNMKRESLNSSESQLNDDSLLPLIDDMLRCRKIHAEKVNAMFGTNISVELSSSWENNVREVEQSLKEGDDNNVSEKAK